MTEQLSLASGDLCDLCTGSRVVESPFEWEHARPMPCPCCSPMAVWLSWVRNPYGLSSVCPSCKAPESGGDLCWACRRRRDDAHRGIPERVGQLGLTLSSAEPRCEVAQ